MSHSKNSVLVRSSQPDGWATRRQAHRLVAQRRAWWLVRDRSIRLNEDDYRFQSDGSHPHSARLQVIPRHAYQPCWINQDAAVLRFEGGNAESQ